MNTWFYMHFFHFLSKQTSFFIPCPRLTSSCVAECREILTLKQRKAQLQQLNVLLRASDVTTAKNRENPFDLFTKHEKSNNLKKKRFHCWNTEKPNFWATSLKKSSTRSFWMNKICKIMLRTVPNSDVKPNHFVNRTSIGSREFSSHPAFFSPEDGPIVADFARNSTSSRANLNLDGKPFSHCQILQSS